MLGGSGKGEYLEWLEYDQNINLKIVLKLKNIIKCTKG